MKVLGDDIRIDIDNDDDEKKTFSNSSITSSTKKKKGAQPLTPELCKRLFDDDTISPSVLNATELSETTVVGSPLASSTQENPDDLDNTVVSSSTSLPSTTVSTGVITLATYKANTPKVDTSIDTTSTAEEKAIVQPLNLPSTPKPPNASTPTDYEVTIAAKLHPSSSPQKDPVAESCCNGLSTHSADEQPVEESNTLNKTVDRTTTQDEAHSRDMKYLFATIGELLEHSKTATTQLQEIPTLVNTVNKLRDEIKEDVANLSGRMLIVEEDVKKISSLVFTKDGNSIVKSNSDQLSNLVKKNNSLNQNISSLKDEVKSLEKRLGENEVLVSSLQLRTEDPNNNTVHYEGWDEPRINELENQIQNLQKQLQEQTLPTHSTNNHQQQHHQQQEPNLPSNDNNNRHSQQRKTRTLPSYKDVTVRRDALLLTDSNGKAISARKINHPGRVQRHTCYTLRDVSTFIQESTIENQPSKLYLQVGTNDLTQHGDVKKLLLDLGNTIGSLKEKFPSCRIYVSNLLPRKDKLNTLVKEFNRSLDQVCDCCWTSYCESPGPEQI